jgi:NAD(P)-dependent dehydrogenase (short-subunit alcohol dehydrogenase family)
MVCRDKDKGLGAVKSIKKTVINATISLETCDLSSLSSVNELIDSIRKKHALLDVLINNAAVLKQKRALTTYGIETMFQVNFLSPAFLMNGLAPLLEKGIFGHIINLTLPSPNLQLDLNDLQFEKSFKSFDAFFKTKLALLLYSLKVSGISPFKRVKITCAVPNTKPFKSNLGREVPYFVRLIKNLISVPVDKVVDNMAYLVQYGIEDWTTGEIFKGKTKVDPSPYWMDEKAQLQIYTLAKNYIDAFSN